MCEFNFIAVAGNNTFEAAAETGVNGNKVAEEANKVSESGSTEMDTLYKLHVCFVHYHQYNGHFHFIPYSLCPLTSS